MKIAASGKAISSVWLGYFLNVHFSLNTQNQDCRSLLASTFSQDKIVWDFPGGSVVKHLPANEGNVGSIPGSGGPPGEGMAMHSSVLAWEIP